MKNNGTYCGRYRKLLVKKYKGGPEIRLVVVGGNPDTNPVVLHYKAKSDVPKAFLFSLNATCRQLCDYLAELTELPIDKMKIGFTRNIPVSYYINPTGDTLMEREVERDTVFVIEIIEKQYVDGENDLDEELKNAILMFKIMDEEEKMLLQQKEEPSTLKDDAKAPPFKIKVINPKKKPEIANELKGLQTTDELESRYQRAIEAEKASKFTIEPKRPKEIAEQLSILLNKYRALIDKGQ